MLGCEELLRGEYRCFLKKEQRLSRKRESLLFLHLYLGTELRHHDIQKASRDRRTDAMLMASSGRQAFRKDCR